MLYIVLTDIYYAIVLIVFFGITIFVHEFCHFMAALYCGLVVDTFSIGFGPAIWKKKIKGIVYKIGWIPFGGYVALPQLDPSGMSTIQGNEKDGNKEPKEAEKENEEEIRDMPPISAWKKILVAVAGPAGNIILAIAFAWIIYLNPNAVTGESMPLVVEVATNSVAFERGLHSGDEIVAVNDESVNTWNEYVIECHLRGGESNGVCLTVKSNENIKKITTPTGKAKNGINHVEGVSIAPPPCQIGRTLPGGSAVKAGIKSGDIVVNFNDMPVDSWEQFVLLVEDSEEKEQPIIVKRKGKLIKLTVKPMYNSQYKKVMIGVAPGGLGVMQWMQYKKPFAQIKYDTKGIVRILRALVSTHKGEAKHAAQALGGPLMIFAVLWMSIKISFLNAIGFIRFLNVNLAILNLLPIPVLDGGHIVFAFIEGVTRKKIHPKILNLLVNIFAALLISAMLILTYRDTIRIFPRISHIFDKEQAVEQGIKPTH